MYTIEIFVNGKWETHMTFDFQEDAFDEFEDICAATEVVAKKRDKIYKVRLTFE